MSSIPVQAILFVVDRYDDIYRQTSAVFGNRPDPILERFVGLIDRSRPVVDIGCGQGRNSLFLARRGLEVHALDPSIEAVRTVDAAAESDDLPITTIHGGFEDLGPISGGFGAILVFGLIPDLRREQVMSLTKVINELLAASGLLMITAFGTWDPAYAQHRGKWDEADENSFCSVDGAVRTYLEPGELPRLFSEMSVVHTWEGLGPEHRHGDGPIERHGRTEAVLRKPG